jgi:hypothetical protein
LERGYEELELLPLSNNTVSRIIDEMSQDVENQLIVNTETKNSRYKWMNR